MSTSDERVCVYCGSDSGIEREHVIPVAFLGSRSWDGKKQWIVDGCRICNSLSGSNVFFSIPSKAEFLVGRYKRKYKKLLRIPYWTDKELRGMDRRLRIGIEQGLLAKTIVQQRMRILEAVANYPPDYMRPEWFMDLHKKWYEEQKRITKKKRIKATKQNTTS